MNSIELHESVKKTLDRSRLSIKSRANLIGQRNWRNRHDGFLPKDVWLRNLETAGSYSCLEIIPIDQNTGIIYLKERKDPTAQGGELDWEGKLHIPGLANLAKIRGDKAPEILLKKEIIQNLDETIGPSKNLKYLTHVKYPEPERRTVADTLILLLPINPNELQDDFKPVTKDNLSQVISQHRPILESYWENNISITMDTR